MDGVGAGVNRLQPSRPRQSAPQVTASARSSLVNIMLQAAQSYRWPLARPSSRGRTRGGLRNGLCAPEVRMPLRRTTADGNPTGASVAPPPPAGGGGGGGGGGMFKDEADPATRWSRYVFHQRNHAKGQEHATTRTDHWADQGRNRPLRADRDTGRP